MPKKENGDQPTDKVGCRVACMRLIIYFSDDISVSFSTKLGAFAKSIYILDNFYMFKNRRLFKF